MASIIKLDANEHRIKSVTIFQSNKAEVVRTFEVSLEEGQSTIQIRHLPGSIDTESVCVTGLGDARLFDVVCSIRPDIQEYDTASTAEQVRRLHARKDVLIKDLDAINDISKTMMDYSKSLAGDSVPPRQAERFFESLLARSREISSTRASLEEDILQLSRQIDTLTSCETKKQGKTNGEMTVVIMTKKATNIELKLTYLVQNATWSAAYELHAATKAGIPASPISLHYRARLTQSTGEDWAGVKLALSTVNMMDPTNQTIPALSPTKIQPPADVEPQLPLPQPRSLPHEIQIIKSSLFPTPAKARPSSLPAALRSGAVQRLQGVVGHTNGQQSAETEVGAAAEELATALGEPTSVVHESPLALTYHVDGASDVPSDGTPHQVSVARVLPLEADILHVAVPKVRPVVYLQASVTNTSEYRLLPGTVHVFVDASFVAKSAIVADIAPGDVFGCPLGADTATHIRFACASRRADNSVVRREQDPCAATTYSSRMTVTNRHSVALRGLVLRDNVPVSEDERRASVVLRRPVGLTRLEQGEELKVGEGESGGRNRTVRWSKVVDGTGGKKEGLFEWVVEVEAGEEVTIETEWDVKTFS